MKMLLRISESCPIKSECVHTQDFLTIVTLTLIILKISCITKNEFSCLPTKKH